MVSPSLLQILAITVARKRGRCSAGSCPVAATQKQQGSLQSLLPGFRLSPRLPMKRPQALEWIKPFQSWLCPSQRANMIPVKCRIVELEKTLESPLDCREIKPVNPKGNQSWIFIGRSDAEAEAPNLWLPDTKSWLIRKDPDAGKDWRQEEKGTTEDELVGWHHQLHGQEFEQTRRNGGGQGSLMCCSPWGHKESDVT